MSKKAKSLPVITYHYVNNSGDLLTVSPFMFEQHCKVLAESGWKSVSLDDAEGFFLSGEPLPPKSVLLTFDDGYLDNYVNVWPILQKYGHKAVIFATAGLVDEEQERVTARGEDPRPTLKDVWQGHAKETDLPEVDSTHTDTPFGKVVNNRFFSWDEARLMEKSGVVAIGGHSLFHDGVFTSEVYKGFSQPGDSLISLNKEVPGDFWGRPLFSRGAFFGERAFVPSPDLLVALQDAVPQTAPEVQRFFADAQNILELEAVMEKYRGRLGRMETDDEWRERLFSAMQVNQEMMSRELGHPVRSFCWPWGISSALAIEAGQAAGFSVFYDIEKGANPPAKPTSIKRMDFRSDPYKMAKRLGTYARPLWGNLYERLRMTTKHTRSAIKHTVERLHKESASPGDKPC